jgi:hypothetical protein
MSGGENTQKLEKGGKQSKEEKNFRKTLWIVAENL